MFTGGIQITKPKRKTIGHSFRINEESLETLTQEAQRQGISVNALTNKILNNYCQNGRWAQRLGQLQLSRSLVNNIMECIPNEKIVEIAKISGSTGAKDALRTMGITPTYDNLMSFIKNNISEGANLFDYNHHNRDKKDIIHLRHELGPKWSMFIATQTATMFESILNKQVKSEVFENYATIEVTAQPNKAY
jgi:hypothetical protein